MHQWARRIVAVAFILLVVLGNIWLMSMFTGSEAPAWTAYGFFVCIALAAVGGLGMVPGLLAARRENQG